LTAISAFFNKNFLKLRNFDRNLMFSEFTTKTESTAKFL